MYCLRVKLFFHVLSVYYSVYAALIGDAAKFFISFPSFYLVLLLLALFIGVGGMLVWWLPYTRQLDRNVATYRKTASFQ